MLDSQPTPDEVAEANRRFNVHTEAIKALDGLAKRFDDIARQAIPPDLFLSIVHAPYPAHPALEDRPNDPPNIAMKPVAGEFVVLTYPSARLWYYGSRDLLGLFLDLTRETTQFLRVINPDFDSGLYGPCNADPRDLQSFEAHAWPLLGLMQVDDPGNRRCERVRWSSQDLGDVPYHDADFERWKIARRFEGPGPPRDANVTRFNTNVFALSGQVLAVFADQIASTTAIMLAQLPGAPATYVRAIEKKFGPGDHEGIHAKARNEFIYREEVKLYFPKLDSVWGIGCLHVATPRPVPGQ